MRDIAVLLAMFVLVPLALRNRVAAYLLWGWTSFVSLISYVYGFMGGVPFNMIFAATSLLLIFAAKDTEGQPFQWNRTVVLFVLFGVQASISALLAIDGNPRNFELWSNILKVLLFGMFMPMVITNRTRIHAMLLTLTLGLALHGTVEGGKFIASGGGHKVQGMMKFGDNNHFGMLIVMTMPMLLYVYQYSQRLIVRLGAIGGVLFALAAVIATHSRGGLLSMGVVATWLVLAGRRKFLGLCLVIIGADIVVYLAPDSWSSRMQTIKTAEEDSSFLGRVEAWKVSSAIAVSRPLWGGGFGAVEVRSIWQQYESAPSLLGFVQITHTHAGRAAHSIYFQVMGDVGFLGLALFIGILACPFLGRRDIRRRCKRLGPEAVWASDLADSLSAALIAYVIGAAALSMAYQEVLYVSVMLMEVLRQHVIRLERAAIATLPAGSVVS